MLAVLAAATMAIPSLAHQFHAPAAAHSEALSLICAGVLLALFLLTLPSFLRSAPGEEHEPARWSTVLTATVLGIAGASAALTSDWFISALTPAIHTLHMSEEFAGLVIVAIAGNAVENVVGVQLAARNRADFAVGVIVNSSLQIALALTPVLVFASLLFTTHLTLVFPTLLALVLLISAILGALIVNDGGAGSGSLVGLSASAAGPTRAWIERRRVPPVRITSTRPAGISAWATRRELVTTVSSGKSTSR